MKQDILNSLRRIPTLYGFSGLISLIITILICLLINKVTVKKTEANTLISYSDKKNVWHIYLDDVKVQNDQSELVIQTNSCGIEAKIEKFNCESDTLIVSLSNLKQLSGSCNPHGFMNTEIKLTLYSRSLFETLIKKIL